VAALTPLSVDGTTVATSTSLLAGSRWGFAKITTYGWNTKEQFRDPGSEGWPGRRTARSE
jgi:hypothetical protein